LPFGVCGWVGLAGGGWGWFGLAAANLVFVTTRPGRASGRLVSLLPDPAPRGQFLASVAYHREGVRTGKDEMALVVVDGWLYAEGVRSHFALRNTDVREARNALEVLQAKLILDDGSEISSQAGTATSQACGVVQRRRKAEPAEGEPIFPPAQVHPQEMARWAARWMSAPLPFLLMPFARLFSPSEEAYVIILFGILLLILAPAVWSARNLFRLLHIEAEALKEAESVLTERAPRAENARTHAIAETQPETPTSVAELPDVRAR